VWGQSPFMHVQPDKGLLFPGPTSAALLQAAALGIPCREQAIDLLPVCLLCCRKRPALQGACP